MPAAVSAVAAVARGVQEPAFCDIHRSRVCHCLAHSPASTQGSPCAGPSGAVQQLHSC